jgi:hypothetical protein
MPAEELTKAEKAFYTLSKKLLERHARSHDNMPDPECLQKMLVDQPLKFTLPESKDSGIAALCKLTEEMKSFEWIAAHYTNMPPDVVVQLSSKWSRLTPEEQKTKKPRALGEHEGHTTPGKICTVVYCALYALPKGETPGHRTLDYPRRAIDDQAYFYIFWLSELISSQKKIGKHCYSKIYPYMPTSARHLHRPMNRIDFGDFDILSYAYQNPGMPQSAGFHIVINLNEKSQELTFEIGNSYCINENIVLYQIYRIYRIMRAMLNLSSDKTSQALNALESSSRSWVVYSTLSPLFRPAAIMVKDQMPAHQHAIKALGSDRIKNAIEADNLDELQIALSEKTPPNTKNKGHILYPSLSATQYLIKVRGRDGTHYTPALQYASRHKAKKIIQYMLSRNNYGAYLRRWKAIIYNVDPGDHLSKIYRQLKAAKGALIPTLNHAPGATFMDIEHVNNALGLKLHSPSTNSIITWLKKAFELLIESSALKTRPGNGNITYQWTSGQLQVSIPGQVHPVQVVLLTNLINSCISPHAHLTDYMSHDKTTPLKRELPLSSHENPARRILPIFLVEIFRQFWISNAAADYELQNNTPHPECKHGPTESDFLALNDPPESLDAIEHVASYRCPAPAGRPARWGTVIVCTNSHKACQLIGWLTKKQPDILNINPLVNKSDITPLEREVFINADLETLLHRLEERRVNYYGVAVIHEGDTFQTELGVAYRAQNGQNIGLTFSGGHCGHPYNPLTSAAREPAEELGYINKSSALERQKALEFACTKKALSEFYSDLPTPPEQIFIISSKHYQELRSPVDAFEFKPGSFKCYAPYHLFSDQRRHLDGRKHVHTLFKQLIARLAEKLFLLIKQVTHLDENSVNIKKRAWNDNIFIEQLHAMDEGAPIIFAEFSAPLAHCDDIIRQCETLQLYLPEFKFFMARDKPGCFLIHAAHTPHRFDALQLCKRIELIAPIVMDTTAYGRIRMQHAFSWLPESAGSTLSINDEHITTLDIGDLCFSYLSLSAPIASLLNAIYHEAQGCSIVEYLCVSSPYSYELPFWEALTKAEFNNPQLLKNIAVKFGELIDYAKILVSSFFKEIPSKPGASASEEPIFRTTESVQDLVSIVIFKAITPIPPEKLTIFNGFLHDADICCALVGDNDTYELNFSPLTNSLLHLHKQLALLQNRLPQYMQRKKILSAIPFISAAAIAFRVQAEPDENTFAYFDTEQICPESQMLLCLYISTLNIEGNPEILISTQDSLQGDALPEHATRQIIHDNAHFSHFTAADTKPKVYSLLFKLIKPANSEFYKNVCSASSSEMATDKQEQIIILVNYIRRELYGTVVKICKHLNDEARYDDGASIAIFWLSLLKGFGCIVQKAVLQARDIALHYQTARPAKRTRAATASTEQKSTLKRGRHKKEASHTVAPPPLTGSAGVKCHPVNG